MRTPSRAVLTLLIAAAAACRAGKPGPRTAAEAGPDVLPNVVGQQRILVGAGEDRELKMSADRASPKEGKGKEGCDVAVTVQSARLDRGVLTAEVTTLGWVEKERGGDARLCRAIPAAVSLTVSGIAAGEGMRVFDRRLPTPEGYLRDHGVPFDLAPEPTLPRVVASARESVGSGEEIQLRRELTARPKRLLAVQALYHDPSGRIRHEGTVAFEAVVGADGRLHDVRLGTTLETPHQEQVRRALGLWRYEPARKGSERMAARIDGNAVLRIR
jgi:hypothetical protein